MSTTGQSARCSSPVFLPARGQMEMHTVQVMFHLPHYSIVAMACSSGWSHSFFLSTQKMLCQMLGPCGPEAGQKSVAAPLQLDPMPPSCNSSIGHPPPLHPPISFNRYSGQSGSEHSGVGLCIIVRLSHPCLPLLGTIRVWAFVLHRPLLYT